jgi:hypothetical protein
MDKTAFETADPIMDEIADAVGVLLDSPETATVRSLLSKLNKAIGKRYAVSLDVNIEVFDREKERCLPLMQTGLSGFEDDKPYQTWGDSTPQRYVVDGNIVVVPHDRCPRCWEVWDAKFNHPTCDHCGATMGGEVKQLLDTDSCPFCEKGNVSMANPVCDKCGHTVDPNTVVWG